jgi:MFS transporter, NNP family, nitrate/nitrite transporter
VERIEPRGRATGLPRSASSGSTLDGSDISGVPLRRFDPPRRRHRAQGSGACGPSRSQATPVDAVLAMTLRKEKSMSNSVDSKWIDHWEPEDEEFWQNRGRRIARRNLIWSIVAENLGFSIWLIWSVTATRLPKLGFHYTTDQLFSLVALPGLVGALVRFPYSFAVPRFGGRNWTIVSALLLFIPTVLLVVLVSHPGAPYWLMALAAATAGLGGGNFASSMANISFFYPDREKGFALGLNAAGGNIGVSTVQLLVPMVIGWSWVNLGLLPPKAGLYVANAGLMWLPFIVLAVYGAARYMDNLSSARSNVKDQLIIARRKDTWVMAWLYIGTFGSFIGYSAAFPLLLKTQFPEISANLAFLGPLVGSIARPIGGRMADALGGTKVTFWNFIAMGLATVAVIHFVDVHQFGGFLLMFLVLFVTTGLGNGSTYRMIPVIFRNAKLADAEGRGPQAREAALKSARIEGATVLGFVSAIGACGGYLIPRGFAASIHVSGSAHSALVAFLFFYATCVGLTWACYMRGKVASFGVARMEAQV